MQKRVAKVVIVNKNREVLFLLRGATAPNRPLTWDLPGGIIEKNETDLQAAIREAYEETKIKLTKPHEIMTHKMLWGNKWIYFYRQLESAKVELSWEHDKYVWHPAGQLGELDHLPLFIKKDVEKLLTRIIDSK